VATGDGRRATGDGRRATGDGRRATGDGRRATGYIDDTARVFSCDVYGSTAQLLALARTHVTRSPTPLERRQYPHQP